MSDNKDLLFLFDKDGDFQSVMLSPELWERAQDDIMKHVHDKAQDLDGKVCKICEPMEDWECLLSYWDFQYPPNAEAHCDECGADSPDWTKDEPRKFTLRAANLGGLVRLQCNTCKANITKRHFKDNIVCECKPFDENGC